jgi:tetraacyldisaccharide 4'-kinase
MSGRSVLAPLTPLYRMGLALRERRLRSGAEAVQRLRLPVISVGNLSTGGAGKTPLTIALAKGLAARGVPVDVLSRGYGRTEGKTVRVRADGSADEFGDEPLLIARQARVPVYVAPRRYDAGLLAESESPRGVAALHLLDDGFQHRQLHRDIDILLLSRADLRDRLLPAGNLREPLSALQRATVLAIPAEDEELARYLLKPVPVDRNSEEPRWIGPVWRLRRSMDVPKIAGPVLAFCGIARPEQFFTGLEAAGVRIAGRRAFRDHYRYTAADLERLATQAKAAGADALLTTEKDAVRLAGLQAPVPLLTAGLRTEIEDEAAALEWLMGRIAGRVDGAGRKNRLA